VSDALSVPLGQGARGDTGRVELDDVSHAPEVRDYFLRLGAIARVSEDGTVEVRFPDGSLADDEPGLRESLDSWSAANGIAARLRDQPHMVVYPRVDPAAERPPMRIGDLLVSKGFLTNETLGQALVESRESGQLLGQTLISKGYVFESDLARTLAEQWSLPYLNLSMVGVDQETARLLPADVGQRYLAIPVRHLGQDVQVAFVDPSDDEAIAAVRSYIGSVSFAVADLSDISLAWRKLHQG
jgi:hypothetical protein